MLEPHEELVYAQLIKKKEKGRLKELTERVLVGAEKLARVGLKISTPLIERVNQTFRHALAPLVRKSRSFCKEREPMKRRVVLFPSVLQLRASTHELASGYPGTTQSKSGLAPAEVETKNGWIDRPCLDV